MIRALSENLGLKLIALGLSILIWFNASSERNPLVSRKVNAKVQVIGAEPKNLIVRVRTDPVPVDVSGPRNEVNAIGDGDVIAYVNIAGAGPSDHDLPITFQAPPSAPNVTFPMPQQFVPAE